MTLRSGSDHALFERTAVDLLEIRLKQGVHIDGACIAAIMRERERLCGQDELCVLLVLPMDAQLDTAVIGTDHYRVNAPTGRIHAVAIVCGTLMLETMARLYAAYYPPAYSLEVFTHEMDARAWLDLQLAELRRSGPDVQPKSSFT